MAFGANPSAVLLTLILPKLRSTHFSLWNAFFLVAVFSLSKWFKDVVGVPFALSVPLSFLRLASENILA